MPNYTSGSAYDALQHQQVSPQLPTHLCLLTGLVFYLYSRHTLTQREPAIDSPEDFPLLHGTEAAVIDDTEGKHSAELDTEAVGPNPGRLARLEYVDQLKNKVTKLLEGHGLSACYKASSLWIRRPDRAFVLADWTTSLPPLFVLHLLDILLLLPDVLLRITRPDSSLCCPSETEPGVKCTGKLTRRGFLPTSSPFNSPSSVIEHAPASLAGHRVDHCANHGAPGVQTPPVTIPIALVAIGQEAPLRAHTEY
ncbi:hypothetical protein P7C70_g8186, partial [Phenoliferia sp. Uapishka_3]